MRRLAVVIHPNDNVAIALKDLKKKQKLIVNADGKRVKITLLDDIPFGHKFALKDINQGGHIIKYGEVIGRATKSIRTGEHVHVQNVESLRCRGDLAEKEVSKQ
ncbi:MAG: UxaA family hydrolase [Candidatus Bathyarchaeia archaeon]